MARVGDGIAVNFLIQSGADINVVDNAGNKPVDLAVLNGHAQIVDLLLETNQACIDDRTYQIATDALHRPQGNDEDSKKRIEIFNTLGAIAVPYTLLHYVAGVGDDVAVNLLIQREVDINAVDNKGNKPVDLAASNRQGRVVDLLLTKGQAYIDDQTYKIAIEAINKATGNGQDSKKSIAILDTLVATGTPYNASISEPFFESKNRIFSEKRSFFDTHITLNSWRKDFIGLHERSAQQLTTVSAEEPILRLLRVTLQFRLSWFLTEGMKAEEQGAFKMPSILKRTLSIPDCTQYVAAIRNIKEQLSNSEEYSQDKIQKKMGESLGQNSQILQKDYPALFHCFRGNKLQFTENWIIKKQVEILAGFAKTLLFTKRQQPNVDFIDDIFMNMEINKEKEIEAIWEQALQKSLSNRVGSDSRSDFRAGFR